MLTFYKSKNAKDHIYPLKKNKFIELMDLNSFSNIDLKYISTDASQSRIILLVNIKYIKGNFFISVHSVNKKNGNLFTRLLKRNIIPFLKKWMTDIKEEKRKNLSVSFHKVCWSSLQKQQIIFKENYSYIVHSIEVPRESFVD